MGLTDYSDLEKEIKSAEAPKILPRGSEVKARIIKVSSGISDKNEARWYMPYFDIPTDPMVSEFNAFFWDLADRDKLDPKQRARSLFQFQQFTTCFGIDISRPFSWEDDLVGKTGWVILNVIKDDEYGDKNGISKYVSGHGKPAVVSGNIKNEDIPF